MLLVVYPATGLAIYSKPYDKALDDLSGANPKQAIKQAYDRLVEADLSDDYDQQLTMLYYLVRAHVTLSHVKETDELVVKGLNLAKKHNKIEFISEFMGVEACQLILKGELRDASRKANQALQFAKETDDYRIIATQLSIRAQVHLAIENYTLALKDTEAALEIFKAHNDRSELSYNYNILGLIYDALDDYDKALDYYKVSISYEDTNSLYNQAVMFYNIGSTYSYKGDIKAAIENLNKSLTVASQIGDEATVAYARHSLAELYLEDDNLVKAEEMGMLAYVWFIENQDLFMHYNGNLLLASINIEKEDFVDALSFLDQAELQLEKLTSPRINLSYLWVRILYFSAQKDWESAFKLSQESLEATEDLFANDKSNDIEDLKLKYDTRFDQEKMAFLQEQNTVQQSVISEEKQKQFYLKVLIILGATILFGALLAYKSQRKIKRSLYSLTIKDDLTQVANRRYILELLEQIHIKSVSNNKPYTVVMIDLDNFKMINDQFGHFAGNQVLIYFAKVVQSLLPEGCHFGRLGGEEWLLILPEFNKMATKTLLDKIRKEYNTPTIVALPADYQLNFSSGVKNCFGNDLEIEEALKLSDKAMYEAKENGRNQDVFCDQ